MEAELVSNISVHAEAIRRKASAERVHANGGLCDAGEDSIRAPAKWLKHSLQQMAANAGRYRSITPEAKRAWHRLLTYNEHDCRGMHAVVMQSAHELELWRAYEATQFIVFQNGREIAIRVGYHTPALDKLLTGLGETRWAFLTAYNPDSAPLNDRENVQRQQQDAQPTNRRWVLPASGRRT